MWPSPLREGRSTPVVVAMGQAPAPGPCDSLPKVWVCREPALASLTGTSSKVMLVTLLWGQLCQALFRRKARALVCRPSRAANFRKVQF